MNLRKLQQSDGSPTTNVKSNAVRRHPTYFKPATAKGRVRGFVIRSTMLERTCGIYLNMLDPSR